MELYKEYKDVELPGLGNTENHVEETNVSKILRIEDAQTPANRRKSAEAARKARPVSNLPRIKSPKTIRSNNDPSVWYERRDIA